ncbi:MAG TPA: hypothetical protein VKX17_10830 [Planctomycetota bacterium]|nr:hypothetical protein [Planctomycetota bacterium]
MVEVGIIDADAEIAIFMNGCVPRYPEVLTEGYGIKQLRGRFHGYNESYRFSQSELAYQGNFSFMARDAMRIAEIEFAMGYPLDRVQCYLRASAVAMLTCVRLRGTVDTVEFTTEAARNEPLPGHLMHAIASVDVSMGAPTQALIGAYCALLGNDYDLALRIARSICFEQYDYDGIGVNGVAEKKGYVSLILGEVEKAQQFASQFNATSARGKILSAICARDQSLFTAGLTSLLKEIERDAPVRIRTSRKEKPAYVPTTYWSLEGLGVVALAMKYDLKLMLEHPYLPREVLSTERGASA